MVAHTDGGPSALRRLALRLEWGAVCAPAQVLSLSDTLEVLQSLDLENVRNDFAKLMHQSMSEIEVNVLSGKASQDEFAAVRQVGWGAPVLL